MNDQANVSVQQEPSDAQLVAHLQQRRAEARLSDDSKPTTPQNLTRETDCGRCVPVRKAEKANRITQRFMPAPLSVWGPPMCPDCFAWNEREQTRLDEEAKAQRLARRFSLSQLPVEYQTGVRDASALPAAEKATDGLTAARRVCRDLYAGRYLLPWVYLWSKAAGTFKSTLACLTLQAAIREGQAGLYVNWPSFFERWLFAGENRPDMLNDLVFAPRLILDEVGTSKSVTQPGADFLYRFLEERIHHDVRAEKGKARAAHPGERWLIFTSNDSPAELVAKYADVDPRMGAPIERRISEFTAAIDVSA